MSALYADLKTLLCFTFLWGAVSSLGCSSPDSGLSPINSSNDSGLDPLSQAGTTGVMMSGDEVNGGEANGGESLGGEIPIEGGAGVGGVTTSGEDLGGVEIGGIEIGGGEVPQCDDLTLCGVSCVDIETDPINCGGCGRTCLIPYAEATCINGVCAINHCEPSYLDLDGQIENGCESASSCLEGETCLTQCGSEGVTQCPDGVEACEPPVETCNLRDDDCDGTCDEDWRALGCRVGIHRGYGRGEHIYSSDINIVQGDGHMLEARDFFYLYQEAIPNGRPVFFCRNTDQRPFLSNQTDCGIGRAPLATLGFWLAAPDCGATPLYALFKPEGGDFFYTIRAMERDYALTLGYEDRGVAGYIWLD